MTDPTGVWRLANQHFKLLGNGCRPLGVHRQEKGRGECNSPWPFPHQAKSASRAWSKTIANASPEASGALTALPLLQPTHCDPPSRDHDHLAWVIVVTDRVTEFLHAQR